MPYIGKAPASGIRSRFIYTATAAQTTFTGADGNGKTLGYTDGEYVDVYLNGVLLDPADYTATSKTSVVLDSGATVSDIVEIVVYDTFSVFNGTFTGDLTVDGDTLFVDSTNNNVLVGKTSQTIDTVGAELLGSIGKVHATRDGGASAGFNRLSDDGEIVQFFKDGTTVGSLGIDGGGFYVDGEANHTGLRFKGGAVTPRLNGAQADNTVGLGNASERFSNLYLGGSLFVGGTGSANELDDYEEGTFTPTYLGSSSNPTVTYNSQTAGSYVKIGRQVIAKIVLRTDSVSGGSGNLYIGGLPFAASAASGTRAGTLNIGYGSNFITKSPQSGYINDSDSIVVLTTNLSNDAVSDLNGTILVSHLQTGTNDNFLMATLIYET